MPFDVESIGTNISGQAVSELLIANLQRMQKIKRAEIETMRLLSKKYVYGPYAEYLLPNLPKSSGAQAKCLKDFSLLFCHFGDDYFSVSQGDFSQFLQLQKHKFNRIFIQ